MINLGLWLPVEILAIKYIQISVNDIRGKAISSFILMINLGLSLAVEILAIKYIQVSAHFFESSWKMEGTELASALSAAYFRNSVVVLWGDRISEQIQNYLQFALLPRWA